MFSYLSDTAKSIALIILFIVVLPVTLILYMMYLATGGSYHDV